MERKCKSLTEIRLKKGEYVERALRRLRRDPAQKG